MCGMHWFPYTTALIMVERGEKNYSKILRDRKRKSYLLTLRTTIFRPCWWLKELVLPTNPRALIVKTLPSLRAIYKRSHLIPSCFLIAMLRVLGFGLGTSILFIPALFLTRHRAVSAAQRTKNPNIAVIGAGIGGSSCSHFIRELFGSQATIDVFEASDRIGGRLATVKIAGKTFESGGSIIHRDNKYMVDFVKYLGKFTWGFCFGVFLT